MKKIRQKKMLKMGALFMVMVMSIVSLCATGTAEALSPASDASIAIAGISIELIMFPCRAGVCLAYHLGQMKRQRLSLPLI